MHNPIDRRTILATAGAGALAAVATPFLSSAPAAVTPTAPGGDGLRARADRKGLLCGSEVGYDELTSDPRVGAALRADANIVVPGVELKWNRLQAKAGGPLDFTRAEAIYDFAHRNGIAMRGHTLAWYRSEPAWATALVPTLGASAAGDLLTRYVTDVAGHWRGRIKQWDVANEAIDGSGKLTEPLFSAKLGERYLDLAFGAAHAADPAALMVFNTDLIEMAVPYQEAHRTATLGLLERLLKRGVPVQALGIEGHISTANAFSQGTFSRFLDEVTGMGLKLMVTEMDVQDRGTLGPVAVRDAATAALGKAFLDVAFSYSQCLGMLCWGESDRYSWLLAEHGKQRSDGAPLRPSLLDMDFSRKPLWHAVAAALDGAPHR